MRISCPPTVAPCYYGIDTPHREELIAARHSVDEIRDFMGADTLAYLSIEGLREAVGERHDQYCNACYTKTYPVDPPSDAEAYQQMVLKIAEVAETVPSEP
jgi:amidophosphoribosyltransferase